MTEAMRRLGIAHPIVQGPFGGGLSTERLAATVSNLGGLGSYGAHNLAPDDIAGVVRGIRDLTAKPFAVNLWVSDHDPGGDTISPGDYERAARALEPYFRELGLEVPPAAPATIGHRF